jgi:hypothetical protein
MKVAIYDVDSKIPNLALMRLSTFHKERGDNVEAYSPLFKDHYDHIYASRLFNFSDGSLLDPERMEIGGTGWDMKKSLPAQVEALTPDYSFYGYSHSIGFTMRGCRFNCKFCVVPQKEGKPKSNSTIGEIWTQRDSNFVVLLDNDFFGNPDWRERIAEIRHFDLKVNFSQGLNIRIITDEQAHALASVKFWNYPQTRRQVYFAWDRFQDERLIDAGIERVKAAGIKAWQMAFYVLIGFDTTPEQDMYRVTKLRDLGCDPYVMPFNKADLYQKRFARWVNHRAIFNSVAWEDYRIGVKNPDDGDGETCGLFAA